MGAAMACLGVLQLVVPALLGKGVLVIDALGVQHRINVDIHQVVEVLQIALGSQYMCKQPADQLSGCW